MGLSPKLEDGHPLQADHVGTKVNLRTARWCRRVGVVAPLVSEARRVGVAGVMETWSVFPALPRETAALQLQSPKVGVHFQSRHLPRTARPGWRLG